MKYGESAFDILYLIFAVAVGLSILCRRRDTVGRLMGSAVLILGIGDAFHLVPRVLNYFVDADSHSLHTLRHSASSHIQIRVRIRYLPGHILACIRRNHERSPGR